MSGNRLPAEWEPQAGIMLTWPHPGTDWATNLDGAEQVFAAIALAVTADEPILIVCRDHQHAAKVRARLLSAGVPAARLHIACAPSDDTWARDHAAITTLDPHGVPCLDDFVFDGWGGKFPAAQDNAINRTLHAQGAFGGCRMQAHDLVLEGGAIESDGAGSLLATRSSVLDRRRNPTWTDTDIEAYLAEHLGIRRFHWLEHGGLSGDDTDAHIDVLARFTDARTIVFSTAPEGDPDHPGLAAMATELAVLRTADGHPYRLLPLPFPGVHRDTDGRRLPASYANFLITNDSVLLPVYGVEADHQAAALLRGCFPGRTIRPIDCRALIAQNGSLHCLTMQFPRAVPLAATDH